MGREIHIFGAISPITKESVFFFRPWCNTQDTYVSDRDFRSHDYKGEVYEHWRDYGVKTREEAIAYSHGMDANDNSFKLKRATGLLYDPFDENGRESGPQGPGAKDKEDMQFDAFLSPGVTAIFMVAFHHFNLASMTTEEMRRLIKKHTNEWHTWLNYAEEQLKDFKAASPDVVQSKVPFAIGNCRFLLGYPPTKEEEQLLRKPTVSYKHWDESHTVKVWKGGKL